jgi:hypothetical protein
MVESFEFDAGIELEVWLLKRDSFAHVLSGLRVIH